MKVCISSTGIEKDAVMDQRFGRCQYFIIFDTKTKKYKAVDNSGVTSSQGAGIAAGQQVLNEKVEAIITGHVGPNAMKVLQGGNVKIYQGKGIAVEDEIKLLQDGKLDIIASAGPAYFGMGNQHRKGC